MDIENTSQENPIVNTNENLDTIIHDLIGEEVDKTTTDEDFIKWIVELRDAYLTNNIEKTEELLSLINHSYLRVSRELEIYNFIIIPPKGYYTSIINDALFYVILHLEGLRFKDDLYLSQKINQITQKNLFNIERTAEELKNLFNDYLNNEPLFILNLSLDTKLKILKMCLTYSLIDEYLSFLELVSKDKTFMERVKNKEQSYEKLQI